MASDNFDYDGMDFGDDLDFGFNEPKPLSQMSKKEIAQDFYKTSMGSMKSNLTDIDKIKKRFKESLPKPHQQSWETLEGTQKDIKDLYDHTEKELKPVLSEIVSKLNDFIPDDFARTKNITGKLRKALAPDEKHYGSYSDDGREQIEAGIKNMLDATFQEFSETQKENTEASDKESIAREAVKEKIEDDRFHSEMKVFSHLDSNINKMRLYQEKVSSKVDKKMLELSFRQYTEIGLIRKAIEAQTELIQAQLGDISKHTAMPEYRKISASERFKDQLKDRAIGSLRNKMFGEGSVFKQGMENIKKNYKSKLLEYSGLGQMLSLFGDLTISDPAGMGSSPNLIGRIGSNLGEALGDQLRDSLVEKIAPFITEGKDTKRALEKLRLILANPQYAIQNLKGSSIVDSLRKAGGGLADKHVQGLLEFLEENFKTKETSLAFESGNTISGMNDPAVFTKRQVIAQTQVIPGYLARILQEVSKLRTKNNNVPMLHFDPTTGQFKNEGQIKTAIEKSLMEDARRSTATYTAKAAAGDVVEDLGISKSYEQATAKLLIDLSRSSKPLTRESVVESSYFKNAPKEVQDALVKIGDKFEEDSLEGDRFKAGTEESLSKIRESSNTYSSKIQQLIDAGLGEHLESMGYLNRKEDSSFITNNDKITDLTKKGLSRRFVDRKMLSAEEIKEEEAYLKKLREKEVDENQKEWMKELFPHVAGFFKGQAKNPFWRRSDVNVKKDFKTFDSEFALNGIKNIPITSWEYKDGKDPGRKVGPMSQSVFKQFGNDVAPDGKKIDLLSLNGINMSAIQGLASKMDNMDYMSKNGKDSAVIAQLKAIKSSVDSLHTTVKDNQGQGFRASSSHGDPNLDFLAYLHKHGIDLTKQNKEEDIVKTYFDIAKKLAGKSYSDAKGIARRGRILAKRNVIRPAQRWYEDNKENIDATKDMIVKKSLRLTASALDMGERFMQKVKDDYSVKALETVKKIKDTVAEKVSRAKDIYIRGNDSPVLLASKMRAGHYVDVKTGKTIYTVYDLLHSQGDIIDIDKDGETALLRSDAVDGLYDQYGNRLGTLRAILISGAMNAARWVGEKVGMGMDFISDMWEKRDWFFGKIGGVMESIKIGFKRLGIGFGTKRTVHVLTQIRDLLAIHHKKPLVDFIYERKLENEDQNVQGNAFRARLFGTKKKGSSEQGETSTETSQTNPEVTIGATTEGSTPNTPFWKTPTVFGDAFQKKAEDHLKRWNKHQEEFVGPIRQTALQQQIAKQKLELQKKAQGFKGKFSSLADKLRAIADGEITPEEVLQPNSVVPQLPSIDVPNLEQKPSWWKKFKEGVKSRYQKTKTALQDHWVMMPIYRDNLKNMSQEDMKNWASGKWNDLKQRGQGKYHEVKDHLDENYDFSNKLQKGKDYLTEKKEELQRKIMIEKMILPLRVEMFKKAVRDKTQEVSDVLFDWKSQATQKFIQGKEYLKDLPNNFQEKLFNTKETLKEKAKQVKERFSEERDLLPVRMALFKQAITEKKDEIKEKLAGGKAAMGKTLKELPQKLKEAPGNIEKGFFKKFGRKMNDIEQSQDDMDVEYGESLKDSDPTAYKQWKKDRRRNQWKGVKDRAKNEISRGKTRLKRRAKVGLGRGMGRLGAIGNMVGGMIGSGMNFIKGFMGDTVNDVSDNTVGTASENVVDRNVDIKGLGDGKQGFNDRDGDGDRDGGTTDMLRRQAQEDQTRKQAEAQKASEAAKRAQASSLKYKSQENAIDQLLKASGGLIDMLKNGASSLFSFGMDVLGKIPGIGKALKGAFRLGKGAVKMGGKALMNVGKWGVGKLGQAANIAKTAYQAGGLRGVASTALRGASTALNIARTASLATGTVSGTLLSGAMTVGRIALMALAGPVTGPLIAGATAAYGAYKLYKYFTRNNADEFQKLRLVQYGLTEEHKEQHRIMALEEYLLDGRVAYSDDPSILANKIKEEEVLEIFEIKKDDMARKRLFYTWMTDRFKPFFLNHIAAVFKADPKKKLQNVKELKYDELQKYLDKAECPDGPYSVTESPFGEEHQMVNTKAQVAEMVKSLRDSKKKDAKKAGENLTSQVADDPKLKAAAATRIAQQEQERKLLQQQSKEADELRTKQELQKLNERSNNNKVDISNPATAVLPAALQGDDGAKPQEANASTKTAGGISTGSTSLGSLPVAKGPLASPTEGDQYIILGEGVRINGINPLLKRNFLAMAAEYGSLTGKKINVNDGHRTYQEQLALRRQYGNRAAKPGTSLHEFGLALDINTADANALEKMGLMRKYGFTRPVGGETWHIEPSGIQSNIQKAKMDPSWATQMVEASLGRGGGGYGSQLGSVKYRRNPSVAKALWETTSETAVANKPSETDMDKGGSTSTTTFVNTQVAKPEIGYKPDIGIGAKITSKSTMSDAGEGPRVQNRLQGINLQGGKHANATASNDPNIDGEPQPSVTAESGNTFSGGKGGKIEETKSAIARAAQKAGMDPNVLQLFAAKESSMGQNMGTTRSSAKGPFQFVDQTWLGVTKAYGSKYGVSANDSRYDPYKSGLMTAALMMENKPIINKYKQNPDIVDYYLGHLLGGGDLGKFMALKDNDIASEFVSRAANNNPELFYRNSKARTGGFTVAQIRQNLQNNFKKLGQSFNVPVQFGNSPMAQGSASANQETSQDATKPMKDSTTSAVSSVTPAQISDSVETAPKQETPRRQVETMQPRTDMTSGVASTMERSAKAQEQLLETVSGSVVPILQGIHDTLQSMYKTGTGQTKEEAKPAPMTPPTPSPRQQKLTEIPNSMLDRRRNYG